MLTDSSKYRIQLIFLKNILLLRLCSRDNKFFQKLIFNILKIDSQSNSAFFEKNILEKIFDIGFAFADFVDIFSMIVC